MLKCNSKDIIVYKELLRIYKYSQQQEKYNSLISIAQIELADKDFNNLQNSISKTSNSNFYNYRYDAYPIYSSNINNGVDSDFIKIFGLPFDVSQEDQPKESLGIGFSSNFTIFLPRKKNTYGRFDIFLNIKDYPNSTGDSEHFYLSYSDNLGLKNITFNLGKSLQTFRGSTILESTILNTRYLTKNNILSRVIISLKDKKYSYNYMSGISKQVSLVTDIFSNGDAISYETHKARNDSFSFKKITIDSGIIQLANDKKLNIFFGNSIFSKKQAIFESKRKDKSLGISLETSLFSKSIKLSFFKTDSNIILYSTKNLSFQIKN